MSQVPIVWVVIKALSLAYCVKYINKEMHVYYFKWWMPSELSKYRTILLCMATSFNSCMKVHVHVPRSKITYRETLLIAASSHLKSYASLWKGIENLNVDYMEPMVTFTTWAKIYPTEYFCNARVLI